MKLKYQEDIHFLTFYQSNIMQFVIQNQYIFYLFSNNLTIIWIIKLYAIELCKALCVIHNYVTESRIYAVMLDFVVKE